MDEEKKIFNYSFDVEDGMLKIMLSLDTDKDGKPVIINTTAIDIAEIPSEIIAKLSK